MESNTNSIYIIEPKWNFAQAENDDDGAEDEVEKSAAEADDNGTQAEGENDDDGAEDEVEKSAAEADDDGTQAAEASTHAALREQDQKEEKEKKRQIVDEPRLFGVRPSRSRSAGCAALLAAIILARCSKLEEVRRQ